MIISVLLLIGLFSAFLAFILFIICSVLVLKQKQKAIIIALLALSYIVVIFSIVEVQPQMIIYNYKGSSLHCTFQGRKYSEVKTFVPVIKDLTKVKYLGMIEDKNKPFLKRKLYKFIFPHLIYCEQGDEEKQVIWVSRGILNNRGGVMNYDEKNVQVEEYHLIN